SMWHQFLEGVWFLHDHGIAHLDLNPGNVLIGYTDKQSWLQLSIINFGISIHVRSEATKVQGYCGTPSWTALEVGMENGPAMSYSPILAEQWS
ncbi:Protein kinase-like domain containing protein, partial [Lactarius tabidus]